MTHPTVDCPDCGDAVSVADRFCEACGVSLTEVVRCVRCGATEIDDGFCGRCGLRQPAGRDHQEFEVGAAAGISDRGLRHSRNEDAMAIRDLPGGVVAVVCDGVSTSDRPDEASQAAVDAAVALLRTDEPEASTMAAVRAAADAVAALAGSDADADNTSPACTYVSAVVTAESVTVGWLGDSRAYWLAGPEGPPSACLTTDDSWAEKLVSEGVEEEQAYASIYGHTITGWLGANAPEFQPHVTRFTPTGPGAVLVCSDGLWNYCREADELAEIVGPIPVAAGLEPARTLVRFALDAGGHDNVTVVVVPFPPREEGHGRPTREGES